jgi:hypothetical protein
MSRVRLTKTPANSHAARTLRRQRHADTPPEAAAATMPRRRRCAEFRHMFIFLSVRQMLITSLFRARFI